jgi:hypothetical protein
MPGLAFLLIVALVLYALVIFSFGVAHFTGTNEQCPQCRYSTVGLTAAVCPECGAVLPPEGARVLEHIFNPPSPVKWACRFLLLLIVSVPLGLWIVARLPVTERAWTEGAEQHPGWTLHIKGSGVRERPQKLRWQTSSLIRASVVLTVTTSNGESGSIRLDKPIRSGVLIDAKGGRLETPNTITIHDMRQWAAGFTDARVRDAVIVQAPWFDGILTRCVLGLEPVTDCTQQSVAYPVLRWTIPILVVYLCLVAFLVRGVRRIGPLRLGRS